MLLAPPDPGPSPVPGGAAYPSMTGVPRIILSASSRNWSAVQTATRDQSHQLVHMTVCRGRLLSLLWPVHGRMTWVQRPLLR